ncbi:MAG: helix-turn-helix domain-containing protein, partial [Candidatus Acidiferrales bacterium]
TRDFRGTFPLLLRSGFGTRNLGPRLRAFRLRHDLTLVETAGLLEISPPQLYHIESSQRRPSPRLRFRLLRLLTLPDALVCHSEPAVAGEGSATCSLRVPSRQSRIAFLRALLSQPPPAPSEFDNDPDRLHRFRYLWLTSNAPTKSFAAQLGISPRHVLRLLRGDRRPSRKLRERIARLVG